MDTSSNSLPLPSAPVEPLLIDREAPQLTPEQLQEINNIALDFRAQSIRLMSERELFLITIKRRETSDASLLDLSQDCLDKIEAQTKELKLEWLSALERARQILLPNQWMWLRSRVDLVPSFDTTLHGPGATDLDTRIAAAFEKRFKDVKVIEIETSQAIADRLFGWAKSFALVVAVPLAILGVVLGILGVKSYTDFTALVTKTQKDVTERLEGAKRDASAIEGQARQIRADYDGLRKQFAETSSLAENVRQLSNRVTTVEQRVAATKLPPEVIQRLRDEVQKFENNLVRAGYSAPSEQFEIFGDATADNAYFDGKKLVVSARAAQLSEVIYYSYTQYALETIHKIQSPASAQVRAIRSGLSDFLTCSYIDNPKFGESYIKAFGNQDDAKRGFLRNLENGLRFDKLTSVSEWEAGEAWGGAFWEIRNILGKERTHRLVITTWTQAWNFDPPETLWLRFANAIVENTAKTIGSDEAKQVGEIFKRRGLSVKF